MTTSFRYRVSAGSSPQCIIVSRSPAVIDQRTARRARLRDVAYESGDGSIYSGYVVSLVCDRAELVHFEQADDLQKRIITLAREVETALGNKHDAMSRVVRGQWNTLCSFTHTGFEQVTRRYAARR